MSQNPNPGQVPGQWPAQPGVPQQGAPQGVPQQAVPQQGVPQGYPQQGVPPQGYPQAYPQQQGYPQQGYPAQPAYGPQAGYGQQGGFPQQGGGRPPGRASSSKVLMIVIGAVLLLVVAGAVLLMLSNRPTPTDPVTPQPVPTTPTASASPTTQPTATTEPTDTPTTQPTEPAPTEPATDVIDLGSGVKFVPAAGWQVQEQAAGAVSVSDGKAVLVTRVVQQKKNTNAGQLCDAFNRQVLAEAAGAKFGDPKDLEINAKNLAVAQCPAAYISTSNGKSTQMAVVTFAAVRTTDGVATLSTMLFTKDTPDSSFADIDKMLGVVLGTQAAG